MVVYMGSQKFFKIKPTNLLERFHAKYRSLGTIGFDVGTVSAPSQDHSLNLISTSPSFLDRKDPIWLPVDLHNFVNLDRSSSSMLSYRARYLFDLKTVFGNGLRIKSCMYF